MCLEGLSPKYFIASINTGLPFESSNSIFISASGTKYFEPKIWNVVFPPDIISSKLTTLKYVDSVLLSIINVSIFVRSCFCNLFRRTAIYP